MNIYLLWRRDFRRWAASGGLMWGARELLGCFLCHEDAVAEMDKRLYNYWSECDKNATGDRVFVMTGLLQPPKSRPWRWERQVNLREGKEAQGLKKFIVTEESIGCHPLEALATAAE